MSDEKTQKWKHIVRDTSRQTGRKVVGKSQLETDRQINRQADR